MVTISLKYDCRDTNNLAHYQCKAYNKRESMVIWLKTSLIIGA